MFRTWKTILLGLLSLFILTESGLAMDKGSDRTAGTTRFANLNGARIAYEVRGHGPRTIVFVHGVGADRSSWEAQLDGLELNARLVAIDTIGHGQSDAPKIQYTMSVFAESISAVLDDLRVKRAVIVGHSNGGGVIRQFYRLHPERVEALVLVDAPIGGTPRNEQTDAQMREAIAKLRGPDGEMHLKAMLGAFNRPMPGISTEKQAHINEVFGKTAPHVIAGMFESNLDQAVWREDLINVPVLALYAKNPYTPYSKDEYRQFLQRVAPKLSYHVWEDVSHFIMVQEPNRFNRLLEEFVCSLGFTKPKR